MKRVCNPQTKDKMWIILFAIFIILLIFCQKIVLKNQKNGNNNFRSSIEKIEEDLSRISKFKATVEVTVQSNKNKNTYTLKQEYDEEKKMCKQEVILPENLKGIVMTKIGDNLKLENTKFGLSQIYEKYGEVTQNHLWLTDFAKVYQTAKEKSKQEENGSYRFCCIENQKKQTLTVNQISGKPQKLSIEEKNQKNRIYILYKEIEITIKS